MQRRHFLYTTLGAATATATGMAKDEAAKQSEKAVKSLFEISLAEWSLHRTIRAGKLKNLDFPKYTKEKFGINAVEYVNGFFKDKAKDKEYLTELKKRTDGEGVKNVLIMIDGEGHLGAKEEKQRIVTVDRHKKWVEAAKFLGCHTIRVNAHGPGSKEELAKQVNDGLTKLSTFAKGFGINVVVENHGGLSSNGEWLAAVLKSVGMDNCGAIPDFGNFHGYDRYKGIKELMPFAKGVSAKSHDFDDKGNEKHTDFFKAMDLVLKAGYHGHVGIEFEGKGSEDVGIQRTKDLLLKVRDKMSK